MTPHTNEISEETGVALWLEEQKINAAFELWISKRRVKPSQGEKHIELCAFHAGATSQKESENVALRLEVWKCDNNEEEIHYFLGTRYVLGYNPLLIKRYYVETILRNSGYQIP